MEERIYKKDLKNGLRILAEEMPGYRSVSIGVWVPCGSRTEEARLNGISHFIEHMLFKGTKNRSVYDIAQSLERVGGHLNAFTGKELNCIHATVLKEHTDLALDVISDLIFNSLLMEEDIEREKGVVIEEINLYEDTPSEHINDLFAQAIFPGHPVGQPVSGTRENIRKLGRKDLAEYIGRNYNLSEFIISAAGGISSVDISGKISAYFEMKAAGSAPRGIKEAILGVFPAPRYSPGINLFRKKLSQVHICLGVPGIPQADEERYAFAVLNLVLGGGMGSRLFQKIREGQGLAYAISSYQVSFYDTGYLALYAGTEDASLKKLLMLALQEMKSIRDDGITAEELESAKGCLRGNLLLGLENTEARMSRLATSEIYMGRIVPTDEVISRIEGIKASDIRSLAQKYISKEKISVSALGSGINESEIKDILEKAG
jgi:predicted Zn-dependent peptidase